MIIITIDHRSTGKKPVIAFKTGAMTEQRADEVTDAITHFIKSNFPDVITKA